MKNIVCLISGRGSNLQAILAAQQEHRWERDPGDLGAPAGSVPLGARVAAVISNRLDAPGLAIAQAQGVPTHVLAHGGYGSRAGFDEALAECIERYAPVLVVLAGFMRVLTPGFVGRYSGRLLNIHPSLLPAFPGLDTHARALAAGVRVHGTTVHYVSGELDAGPIVAQAALGVGPGETPATLAARVLGLEHVLLPRCIEWIVQGRVRLEAGRVVTEALGADDLLVRPA
jgi:phosphoribosylglycinamide formyltransferase-1